MAIEYIKDVLPLEEAGKTDVEIATYLSNKTQKGIDCRAAIELMEELGSVIIDPVTGDRSGTLVDTFNGLPTGENKDRLRWFLSYTYGRGAAGGLAIPTHNTDKGVELAGVLAGLTGTHLQLGQDLIALGGGQPFAGTVEQDVIDARAAYNTDETRRAAYNAISARAGAAVAAAQASWDNKETPAQITAAAEAAWNA